jgi:choice-of-anchor C domain-containing protein
MRRALVVVLLAIATGASAAPFQNGSFEGTAACNTFNVPAGTTFTPGWTVSVGNIDFEGTYPSCGWTASNGSNSLDLVGTGGIGGVSQTFDTVAGQTYTVSFDLAGNPAGIGGSPIKPLTVTVDGVTHTYTFDTTGRTAAAMGWVTRSFTFVASGASATINFVSDITADGGFFNAGAALDNVQVFAGAAPAPTSGLPVPLDWAQLGAALLLAFAAFVTLRRRRARVR